MLNIKKVIYVVAILLVSVLSLSLIIRTTTIGTAGTEDENGYTGIGLPENGVEIINRAAPLLKKYKIGDGAEDLRIENFDSYSLIEGSTENSNSYINLFSDTDLSDRAMSDYSFFKVEFDIIQVEGFRPSNCTFYLTVKEGGVVIPSQFHIRYDESDEKMLLKYGEQTVKANSFHVEYVIEAYPENLNMLRIQFFVNGKLISDTKRDETIISSDVISYLSKFRIWHFDNKGGKLIVKDLKLTGYPKD